MHASLEIVDRVVILNLPQEHGNGVRVIFGGNDGILITIDGSGHIVVRGPEGPGDPEVRQAMAGILSGVEVLARTSAVGVEV
ncbi:MAG: hypothetical protein ACRD3T_09035 [Terriglobia bacterium]